MMGHESSMQYLEFYLILLFFVQIQKKI
jgi:hypothetical protein